MISLRRSILKFCASPFGHQCHGHLHNIRLFRLAFFFSSTLGTLNETDARPLFVIPTKGILLKFTVLGNLRRSNFPQISARKWFAVYI